MKQPVEQTTIVIYHANCYDGFGAAYVAWTMLGATARYIKANYGDSPPEFDDRIKAIYVLDFSYPRAILEALHARLEAAPGGVLRVLDHHKTAQDNLEGLPYCTFDMTKSGAMLAWEHFYPRRSAPDLILYVQDRDLWTLTLPQSREVSAALRSYPFDFYVWNGLVSSGVGKLKQEGGAILRYQDMMVNIMCDQAIIGDVGGHKVHIVNASVFFSEVGEELCIRYPDEPFSAYYFDRADGKRQWGLRSRGGFDCSAVAKLYGGGGHPGAAGFTTPKSDLSCQAVRRETT